MFQHLSVHVGHLHFLPQKCSTMLIFLQNIFTTPTNSCKHILYHIKSQAVLQYLNILPIDSATTTGSI